MKKQLWLNVTLLLVVVTAHLHAAEVNQRQRPSPSTQVKVTNAIAKSYSYISDTHATQVGQSDSCGNTLIGTIVGGVRANDVENTVVARGDIITVNRNVRCP